jgi:signal transduction histidine kinase
MLKELKEERNNPNRDRATEDEILEIFDQNMEKIAMHGQRADSIIKNMLEHSQTSRGSKEMVDINKLAEERLRIAYHALQGKLRATEPNKDHPDVQLETDFDAGLGAVNIVPEDISRVLLNLYNNALYSVNEKFHRVGTEYKPIVRVTTRRVDERVQISVWDNGEGIPDKILSKIFQPFFTTRPTGKGTGLGLSLSYDIIAKTYGGEIRVNSQEGEWAEFVIGLPV